MKTFLEFSESPFWEISAQKKRGFWNFLENSSVYPCVYWRGTLNVFFLCVCEGCIYAMKKKWERVCQEKEFCQCEIRKCERRSEYFLNWKIASCYLLKVEYLLRSGPNDMDKWPKTEQILLQRKAQKEKQNNMLYFEF